MMESQWILTLWGRVCYNVYLHCYITLDPEQYCSGNHKCHWCNMIQDTSYMVYCTSPYSYPGHNTSARNISSSCYSDHLYEAAQVNQWKQLTLMNVINIYICMMQSLFDILYFNHKDKQDSPSHSCINISSSIPP